jgi:hypothetical protein
MEANEMSKKIPATLKRRLLNALSTAGEPMPSSYYSEISHALPPSCHRSATQMTGILKSLRKDFDEIEAVALSKNGLSKTGAQRIRQGWHAPTLCLSDEEQFILPEAKKPLKKISVNLPLDCVEYLASMKDEMGMSPAKVFIDMIRSDMKARSSLSDDS